MRPYIGLTCGHQWGDTARFYVNEAYVEAILAAGGIPFLIPYMDKPALEALVDRADGVLVPGGIDVDAQLFGEDPHPGCGDVDPVWDSLDLTVIQHAMGQDMPMLAICRGVQILNVAAGGTLIQDIGSQVAHPIQHTQRSPRWHATHSVQIGQGSHLARILKADVVKVNSFHHQAVKQVAPGFSVSATANDGVIEGIESAQHRFVVGVQWHPELMVQHYPTFLSLFTELVTAASFGKGRCL